MSEILSASRTFIKSGGSKKTAPSSMEARYNELSHTGGESFESVNIMRTDTIDVCPKPLSSVACEIFSGKK